MKVWHNGAWIDMSIGQTVTVVRVSSGRAIFGESATLTKATKQHLIFTTASGAIVKTKVDNIHIEVGRAKENGYVVSLKTVESFTNFIPEEVRFWDRKTCTFVKK